MVLFIAKNYTIYGLYKWSVQTDEDIFKKKFPVLI